MDEQTMQANKEDLPKLEKHLSGLVGMDCSAMGGELKVRLENLIKCVVTTKSLSKVH